MRLSEIKRNEPLAKQTTLGIGGPAELWYEAKTRKDLIEAVRWARNQGLLVTILGWGSNVLVGDKGIKGLVIHNLSQEVKIGRIVKRSDLSKEVRPHHRWVAVWDLDYDESDRPRVRVSVDSGVGLPFLINYLIDQGVTGLQWYAGIPGTIGGAIFNNIHGGTHFFGEVVESVKALSREGEMLTLTGAKLGMDYDRSRFHQSGEIIIQVGLQLYRGDVERARQTAMEWASRKKLQPRHSPGCVFKNISPEEKERLKLPTTSVGYIIEHILKMGGFRIGGAAVSRQHHNFIVNEGGATARDYLMVMREIRRRAKVELGLVLEPEIFLLGDFGGRVVTDSRKVEPGDTFVAYRGVEVDGHDFIDQAIEKGAVAVVGENKLALSVPYTQVKNGRLEWARLVAQSYGCPEKKLKIVGVTGTDGKTTTVNLIYQMLKAAGKQVGLVSTVGALIGGQEADTGLHTTSPDPDLLWQFLDRMVKTECEYAVLEVTSHGLVQERFGEIEFEIGVLTNVGSDHLEFHGTRKNYFKAKARLFEKSKVSVLNERSWGFEYLKRRAKGEVIGYVGRDYMEENILAASCAAKMLGVTDEAIGQGVRNLGQLPGRFERVENDRGLNLIVDFAHTEQGMRAILGWVRQMRSEGEKIIVMFGCNGERDRSKRGPMGQAAVELADAVIVTMEDPRRESPDQIFADIEEGIKRSDLLIRVDDRREAIRKAISLARTGDWVLFLGKGHERSMNINGVEFPWNEVEEVKKAL